MARPKVALVHPHLGFGGSEGAVMWSLEALRDDYDLTLITGGEVDLPRLNQYYGTAVRAGDFSYRRLPVPAWLERTGKFAALQGRFGLRYVRKVASQFDVLIGLYGPLDCGRRCIQRIADFSFVEEWRLAQHPGVRGWNSWWYAPASPLRAAYLALCDGVCRSRPDGWKRNLTLSNSAWTQALMREKFGVESTVGYAPVVGEFPAVPFANRERGFVCVGRISPEKRVDAIIEILSQVRSRGYDIHLHVLGGVDHSAYGTLIQQLAGQNPDWVFLEGWAAGDEKRALLAHHRFGIHGRPNEPFGIAVAEMVLAGCIVFVPNGGGQVEIVNHPDLIFANETEAVEKIVAVLADEAQQQKLCGALRTGTARFSAEAFVTTLRRTVKDFLNSETARS